MFEKNVFDQGIELFIDKWIQHQESKAVVEYIKAEYFNRNRNWYKGYDIFAPSINDCIEAFNRTLKKKYLKYRKMPPVKLTNHITNIFEDFLISKTPIIGKIRYDEPSLIYNTSSIINFKFLKNSTKEKIYLIRNDLSQLLAYVVKTKIFSIFQAFNEFKEFYQINKYLFADHEVVSHECIKCTCYAFLKNKRCIHI